MPDPDDRKDFFISYTKADQSWAEWIADQLESAGYSTVIQAWDFRPGSNFVMQMADASQKARATLVVLSTNYFSSQFAMAEWAAAFRTDPSGSRRSVIPVRVDLCDVEGLFGPIIYIDLHGLSRAVASKALLDGIKEGRNKPSTAVPFPGKADETESAAKSTDETETSAKSANEDSATDLSASEAAEEWHFWQTALWYQHALDFFDERLCEAFPGARGLCVFSGQDAFRRVSRLLRDPLAISEGDHASCPLWWWRGIGHMFIDQFRVLDQGELKCLLGHDELVIDTVAVYREPRLYRSFVYVSALAEQPTGIRPITPRDIRGMVKEIGYAREGVGYWNGHYVTYEEYQDGHAEIDGEIIRIQGAELRIRHLTPYNLFISSQVSVLNSVSVDATVDEFCKGLLSGTISPETVVENISKWQLKDRVAHYYFALD